MDNETRKLPFDCKVIDKDPVEVANPYSGETCTLEPDAIAVYDTIKGAELFEQYDLTQRHNNTSRTFHRSNKTRRL